MRFNTLRFIELINIEDFIYFSNAFSSFGTKDN